MSIQLIKYILIGEPTSQETIGSYPPHGTLKRIRIKSYNIFKMYCNNNEEEGLIEKKNVIKNIDGNYYCKITKNNIFYLIVTNKSIEENEIFKLIDNIESSVIQSISNKKKELNSYQLIQLELVIQNFISKYKKNDTNETKERINDNNNYKKNAEIIINNNNIDSIISEFENEIFPFKFKIYIIFILILIILIIIFIPLI